MKAAIVNPYLDTLGGGERYTISFARALSDLGFSVDVQWPKSNIKAAIEKRFGIQLKKINFVPDVKRGDTYDLCFWVSDGSIPTLLARKNILHFQVPFHDVGGRSLLNKMKLIRINNIVVNSLFTKKIIDEEYGVNSLVIYPPADILQIRSKRKENIILSVARFSDLLQSKRQDILIDVFKSLYDNKTLQDWQLVLAGGSDVGTGNYVENLKKLGEGYPIEILESPSFLKLKELYGISKFFWSASGYGVNENEEPAKVEHFGITVVEAMSAGCVPFVFEAGGHKEIVADGTGFLWNTPQELTRQIQDILKTKSKIAEISKSAKISSQKFSFERFREECEALVK